MSRFTRATKKRARLRMALIGPAGSGKTYTALEIASHLGDKVAVIDTERGSASKYSDIFSFCVSELDTYEPHNYVSAIEDAEKEGFDVIVIDSLSHAWFGKGGAIDQVDKRGGRYSDWRFVTPQHNALVDAIIRSKSHVIVTMRTKTEYVVEVNEKGKSEPRKIGLAPVQRDGLEYEFDVTADIDDRNSVKISKTRCSKLSGAVFRHQNEQIAAILTEWLSDGKEEEVQAKPEHASLVEPTMDPGKKAQDSDLIRLSGRLEKIGIASKDERIEWIKRNVGRNDISKLRDLTQAEADSLIAIAEAPNANA